MPRKPPHRARTIKELDAAYPATLDSLEVLSEAKTRLDAEILAREWRMTTVTAPLGVAVIASLVAAVITTLPTLVTAPETVRGAHGFIWVLFALLATAYSCDLWIEQKHAIWCLDRRRRHRGELGGVGLRG